MAPETLSSCLEPYRHQAMGPHLNYEEGQLHENRNVNSIRENHEFPQTKYTAK